VAAPKSCGFCLEPLSGCCCDDEPAGTPVPGTARASGLTVLRVHAGGADTDPGEPDPELYHVDSGAERM
jgi:hypothetical protein